MVCLPCPLCCSVSPPLPPLIHPLCCSVPPSLLTHPLLSPPINSPGASVEAAENFQSKESRAKLDGLYECILCACCR